MGKKESEKEFKYVLYLLRYVLREIKAPMSVSFLNSTFASKFKTKSAITEDFMRQFNDEFKFWIIGDDLKIQLKGDSNPPEAILVEYQADVNELNKILSKDFDKAESIKKDMLPTRSMSLKNFCDKFSSRKNVVSYPFLCRNSHVFKLRGENGETYVEIIEDDNSNVTEHEFWTIFQSEGFKKVVLRNVLNFFRKFYVELNIGKLQACFHYGRNVTIGKTFMAENSEYFEKTENSAMLFKLKEEYRKSKKCLVVSTTIMSTKNKDKDEVNEVKTQNSVDEVISIVEKSKAEVNSSVISSESASNSDNESDSWSDTDLNSPSEGEDDDMNESSAENIKEEIQKRRNDSEKYINENESRSINNSDVDISPLNTEYEGNCENDEMQKTEKKVDGEENSVMKKIKEAYAENRSVIFVVDNDSDPELILERTGSKEEKTTIKKIIHLLLEELSK